MPYCFSARGIHSELTLGTARLGMEYGIVNRSSQPARPLAIRMVHEAVAHGVTALDTARGYGEAEGVLGEALNGAWRSRVEVITKLDPLASLTHDAEPSTVRAAVDDSVRRSREALRSGEGVDLAAPSFHHHRAWGGAVWRRLLELRAEGTIGTLGASVYEPREALELLQDPAIPHLQIPMNVLDWRWSQWHEPNIGPDLGPRTGGSSGCSRARPQCAACRDSSSAPRHSGPYRRSTMYRLACASSESQRPSSDGRVLRICVSPTFARSPGCDAPWAASVGR